MSESSSSSNRVKLAMQDMTWREIAAAREGGFDTVIIMVGSIEQHGPHLPISTDTLIADDLAVRMAVKMGNTLVAPTIRPGCSDHHMSLPGTISHRPVVLFEILRDYCAAMARHGFKKLVLASSHGGNFAPLETFVSSLVGEFPQLRIIHYGNLRGYVQWWNEEVEKLQLDPVKALGHSCLGETSMILRLKPDIVREDYIEPGYTGSFKGVLSRILRDGIQAVTKNGILGDPTGSTAEIGEALLDGMASRLAEWASLELQD